MAVLELKHITMEERKMEKIEKMNEDLKSAGIDSHPHTKGQCTAIIFGDDRTLKILGIGEDCQKKFKSFIETKNQENQ